MKLQRPSLAILLLSSVVPFVHPTCSKITSSFAARAQGDNPPDELVSNLFDGKVATKWLNFISQESQKDASLPWVEVAFDSQRQITKYAITSALDHLERDPQSWSLLGWANREWVVLDQRDDEAFHARGMVRYFYAPISETYTRYKFNVTGLRDPTAASGVQLADIAFYEGTCLDDEPNIVIQSISGDLHHVLRMSDGTVQTWGDGSNGKLGHGNVDALTVPLTIEGLNAVIQVAAGGSHTLFLMEDGTMQSVGSGAVGQLGHGDNKDQHRPKLIMASGSGSNNIASSGSIAFRLVQQVAAGQHHSIALMDDGSVATFGLGIYGQLGITLSSSQTYVDTPTVVPNVGGITKVEGGSLYTLLYQGAGYSAGQILMKFGVYPNFKVSNSFPQMTADTSYSNSLTQESRFWSSPSNEHHGKVKTISHADRPPIVHWNNEKDALPTVYGGHDNVASNGGQNLDILGPPVTVTGTDVTGTTEMDKDLTTRGQMLVQELEDTSWSAADDSPNAR